MRFSKSKKNIQWDKYMVYIIFVAVFVPVCDNSGK